VVGSYKKYILNSIAQLLKEIFSFFDIPNINLKKIYSSQHQPVASHFMYREYADKLAAYRAKDLPSNSSNPVTSVEGISELLSQPEWKKFSDNKNIVNPKKFFQGNIEGNLIFTSENILEHLKNIEIEVNCDGTHNTTNKLFKQLFTIHLRDGNVVSTYLFMEPLIFIQSIIHT
jgi:hypothetical protein